MLFLNSIDEQLYMILERAAPAWVDDIESEIMESALNGIVTEISEVIDDDDDYFKNEGRKVDVGDMFGAGQMDIAPTPNLDKSQAIDYNDYGIYDKGVEYVGNGTSNGTSEADYESMKADLIADVMGLYDADKERFIKQHEVEKAHILKELQKVQEEKEKDRKAHV